MTALGLVKFGTS